MMTESCSLVIFGSTGNLARNKLLPALYPLDLAQELAPATRVLGFGHRDWSDARWREEVTKSLAGSDFLRVELQVKQAGSELRTQTERLDASSCALASSEIDTYEALILDVIAGDHSLFLRTDEVGWAWRIVDPVLKLWSTERDFIQTYPAGSWGPQEATRLFDRDDQDWRNGLES